MCKILGGNLVMTKDKPMDVYLPKWMAMYLTKTK